MRLKRDKGILVASNLSFQRLQPTQHDDVVFFPFNFPSI